MKNYPDQTRNLNPHKEAVVAMTMWGCEYANSGGGCMDFWDQLDKSRKRRCKALVDRLEEASKRTREKL